MSLAAGCPRCSAPVTESGDTWTCEDHGVVPPLWRPDVASYDSFTEHLAASDGFPTYVPWPLSPGWQVTDFGVVGVPGRPRENRPCDPASHHHLHHYCLRRQGLRYSR